MADTNPLYHKINSVFDRDPGNRHKTFLMEQWAEPEFGYLADLNWVATEKIDGTNCRIHLGTDTYQVGGRTDNAQLHVDLVGAMQDIAQRALPTLSGLTLYGEGYGAGIQKGGGDYRPDKGFILFDVMVTGTGVFLEREDVNDIADQLDIKRVDVVFSASLHKIVDHYRTGGKVSSAIRSTEAEGWVLRPERELRTRLNRRVITKLKVKDFPERDAAQ